MISHVRMIKYIYHLKTLKQPITNPAIAKLHNRKSGQLSGQEIGIKKEILKSIEGA